MVVVVALGGGHRHFAGALLLCPFFLRLPPQDPGPRAVPRAYRAVRPRPRLILLRARADVGLRADRAVCPR